VRSAAIIAVLLVLPAAHARSQSAPTDQLHRGAWSLSFTLPSGGGEAVGAWKMVGARTGLGLVVGYSSRYSDERYSDTTAVPHVESGDWAVRLEPTLKLYRRPGPNVATYLLATVGSSYQWNGENYETSSSRDHGWSLYARAGFGVEWFPLSAISVDGWMAVGTGATWSHHRYENGSTSDRTDLNGQTLTSALALHIYL